MNLRLIGLLMVGFLAFMVIVAGATLLAEKQDADQMKTCVEAGKSWVRSDSVSGYYECK